MVDPDLVSVESRRPRGPRGRPSPVDEAGAAARGSRGHLCGGGVQRAPVKQMIDNAADPAMIFHGKAVAQRSSRPSIKLEDVGSNPTGLAALVVEERRLAPVRPGRAEGGAAP